MLNFYLNLNKYNVNKDLNEQSDLKDLYFYKQKILIANGFSHLVPALPNTSVQFTKTEYDEEGVEVAVDVEDVYPVSLEEEKAEIISRRNNLEYLETVHNTFEHCRTRCKVADQRLRNFTVHSRDHQMCLADCMNVRTELYNKTRPGDKKEITFVWLA